VKTLTLYTAEVVVFRHCIFRDRVALRIQDFLSTENET
jgi:hypothetical protein